MVSSLTDRKLYGIEYYEHDLVKCVIHEIFLYLYDYPYWYDRTYSRLAAVARSISFYEKQLLLALFEIESFGWAWEPINYSHTTFREFEDYL